MGRADKYVCAECARELVAREGDVSGSALYADCDRVRWRKVSTAEGLNGLEEGMTFRTVNGNLFSVSGTGGWAVEQGSMTACRLSQVSLPVWVMDIRRD